MAELAVVGQDRSELFRFKVGMIPTLASLSRGSDLMNGGAITLRTISAAMFAACIVAPAFAIDGKASIDLEEYRIGVPPSITSISGSRVAGSPDNGAWF